MVDYIGTSRLRELVSRVGCARFIEELAAEIEADIVLKGTHGGVDGVYSEDPRINAAAVKFEEISFDEVIARDLRAMDMTAITATSGITGTMATTVIMATKGIITRIATRMT